jgi:hypothetical protein
MGRERDRGLRSPPSGPVKIFVETFGPLPLGSTPSLPTPRGCPICPASLSCSSVSRRVITAVVGFAHGEFPRTCRASSSVHCDAGLLSQTGSAAVRQVTAATSVGTRNVRICHPRISARTSPSLRETPSSRCGEGPGTRYCWIRPHRLLAPPPGCWFPMLRPYCTCNIGESHYFHRVE